jgi:hypothetical protein
MKRVLVLFALLIYEVLAFCQSVPPGIPYQAVVRNTDGSVAANANLTARFTLHQNTTDGVVEFQETHALVSNAQGLVSAVIGQGTEEQSSFSAIVWSNTTKFLQVEMDLGNGYVDLGTQQLMSVPFAMYAASGTPGPQGPAGPTGAQGPIGPVGPQGEVGPQGSIGLTGPAGATGATGPQGIQGPTGLVGPQGEVGPQGPVGAAGATGPQGIQGSIGPVGPQGEVGPQGPIGLTGPIGAIGATGATGPQGIQGPIGPVGPQGEVGPQGPIGLTGPVGATGVTGPQGDVGPQGEIGIQGPSGASGLSAYEVWIASGNVGTEQEFINSLKGPKGDSGISGVDGVGVVSVSTQGNNLIINLSNGTSQTIPFPSGNINGTGSNSNTLIYTITGF